ncbi:MAG TPA: homoserine kinase [Nitrospiria bacterium]|jgi:homoserine kinase
MSKKQPKIVTVFAPASVGNIGPGFDVLGCAVTGIGDWVTASLSSDSGIRIHSISGTQTQIPKDARKNTVGIAAQEVRKRLGIKKGVDLWLHKNIPGNGLGSSAASAVAGGFATNILFGEPLKKEELLIPCAKAESRVSGGYFLDNISASLFGGVVISNPKTKKTVPLGVIPNLVVVLVTPHFPLLTKRARKVLPLKIPMAHFIQNMAFSCALVAAVGQKNVRAFGEAIEDVIVEPKRSVLIPGFSEVKKAALKNGAFGCSISGAGSTLFAITDHPTKGEKIGRAMQQAFQRKGLKATVTVSSMDRHGVRMVKGKIL